jgi:hypothetical protein
MNQVMNNAETRPGPDTQTRIQTRRAQAEAVLRLRELDRRRDRWDIRFQLRQHARLAAAIGGGALLLIGGAVALRIMHARRRRGPLETLSRLRQAVARMIERPERVAVPAPPALSRKAIGAALGAGSSALAKALIARELSGLRPRRA